MATTTSRSARRRNTARATLLPEGAGDFLRRRLAEAAGATILVAGTALLLALISYVPADPSWNTAGDGATVRNLMGVPGAYAADLFIQTLGAMAFVAALVPMIWGWRRLRHQHLGRLWLRVVALLVCLLLGAAALAPFDAPSAWSTHAVLGGAVGRLLLFQLGDAALMGLGLTDLIWTALACGVVALLLVPVALGLSAEEWRGAAGRGGRGLGWVFRGASLTGRSGLRASVAAAQGLARRAEAVTARKDPVLGARATGRRAPEGLAPRPEDADDEPVVEVVSHARSATLVGPRPTPVPAGRRAASERQPKLDLEANDDYELPPLDLLRPPDPNQRPVRLNEEALRRNAEILIGVLGDFGVKGEIVRVNPGPVVTLYELEPAPGTKSSRVIGLADDIARSMSAISVRVAVVPGRNAIGIELPNAKREMVLLREMLAADAYDRSAAKLALVLGKDIGGAPMITDLARMPHLLVAGTTGSGKSVAINTMILSLLYRLTPEKVRFIMVDPKMLELSVYDGIPHLLSPVVTEPKLAVVAMKWTVREMEDRYRSMSRLGVRNIEGYNQRLREAKAKGEVLTRRVQTGFDADTGKPVFEDQPFDLTELPYIVVVVDEMADLMMVAGKEIEAAIQRLAQMARAAGIHLIMATQRPSVDVITGTIKANFPTRISFQVTSKIDSRTILQEGGAEQLLGQGDMLYMAGGGRITRVHGPFVDDREVEMVVRHLKAQGEPDYNDQILEDEEENAAFDALAGGGEGGGTGDDLYDRAVALVAREGKASTSFVQRHLQIGYNRAARIIEKMESEGVVSKANHVGKREVLVGDHGG
ncbi:MAG: DNA translocase FtsK [Inquilinaceae bacterium]